MSWCLKVNNIFKFSLKPNVIKIQVLSRCISEMRHRMFEAKVKVAPHKTQQYLEVTVTPYRNERWLFFPLKWISRCTPHAGLRYHLTGTFLSLETAVFKTIWNLPTALSERGNKSDHIKMICKHQTLKACFVLGQALPFVRRLSEMMQESFCLDLTMNMHLVKMLLMTSCYKFCWISHFFFHFSNTSSTGKVLEKYIFVCHG